jgi:hypothetical protein
MAETVNIVFGKDSNELQLDVHASDGKCKGITMKVIAALEEEYGVKITPQNISDHPEDGKGQKVQICG